jgi:hypothetical protein
MTEIPWWIDQKVEHLKVYRLPPLGQSILLLLIEQYGPKDVARAVQFFTESEEHRNALMTQIKNLNDWVTRETEIRGEMSATLKELCDKERNDDNNR